MWLMSCQGSCRLERLIVFLIKHSGSTAPLPHAHINKHAHMERERDPNLAASVQLWGKTDPSNSYCFKQPIVPRRSGSQCLPFLWFFVLAREKWHGRGRRRNGCGTRLERGRGGEEEEREIKREIERQPMRRAASWKSKWREREREGEHCQLLPGWRKVCASCTAVMPLDPSSWRVWAGFEIPSVHVRPFAGGGGRIRSVSVLACCIWSPVLGSVGGH